MIYRFANDSILCLCSHASCCLTCAFYGGVYAEACLLKAEKGSYIIFCIAICLANRFTYTRNDTTVVCHAMPCHMYGRNTHNTLLRLKRLFSFSFVCDLVWFGKHLSRIPKCQKKKRGGEKHRVEKKVAFTRTLSNPPDFIGCCVKSHPTK